MFLASDRDVEDPSPRAWLADPEAATEALGLESFDLLGISQAGPIAIEYAARHPDRSSAWCCTELASRQGRART